MDAGVKRRIDSYPASVRPKLIRLRELIMDAAKEYEINDLVETLKWGEPSYTSKYGSAVRFDWKPKNPEQYAVYFNCNTTLVETFRERYGDDFRYESNRAIVFKLDDKIPEKKLKHCIALALRYKKLKHLPLLGA